MSKPATKSSSNGPYTQIKNVLWIMIILFVIIDIGLVVNTTSFMMSNSKVASIKITQKISSLCNGDVLYLSKVAMIGWYITLLILILRLFVYIDGGIGWIALNMPFDIVIGLTLLYYFNILIKTDYRTECAERRFLALFIYFSRIFIVLMLIIAVVYFIWGERIKQLSRE